MTELLRWKKKMRENEGTEAVFMGLVHLASFHLIKSNLIHAAAKKGASLC